MVASLAHLDPRDLRASQAHWVLPANLVGLAGQAHQESQVHLDLKAFLEALESLGQMEDLEGQDHLAKQESCTAPEFQDNQEDRVVQDHREGLVSLARTVDLEMTGSLGNPELPGSQAAKVLSVCRVKTDRMEFLALTQLIVRVLIAPEFSGGLEVLQVEEDFLRTSEAQTVDGVAPLGAPVLVGWVRWADRARDLPDPRVDGVALLLAPLQDTVARLLVQPLDILAQIVDGGAPLLAPHLDMVGLSVERLRDTVAPEVAPALGIGAPLRVTVEPLQDGVVILLVMLALVVAPAQDGVALLPPAECGVAPAVDLVALAVDMDHEVVPAHSEVGEARTEDIVIV